MKRSIRLVALLSIALCSLGAVASEQKRSKSPVSERRQVTMAAPQELEVVLLPKEAKESTYWIRFLSNEQQVSKAFILGCGAFIAQRAFEVKRGNSLGKGLAAEGHKKITWDVSKLLVPVLDDVEMVVKIGKRHSAEVKSALVVASVLEMILDLEKIFVHKKDFSLMQQDRLLVCAKLADLLGNQKALQECSTALLNRLLGGVPPKRTFAGHTGWVNGVEVLPGGKQFLSWSRDSTIKLWDVDPQQGDGLVRTFAGHTSWVNSIAVLPGGKQFLSWSDDDTIKLWDVNPQQGNKGLVHEFRMSDGRVRGFAVLPGEKQFLSWSDDEPIRLWNLNPQQGNNDLVHTFDGRTDGLKGVEVLPGGKQFLSCSGDKAVNLWDVNPQDGSGLVHVFHERNVATIGSVYFTSRDQHLLWGQRNDISLLEFGPQEYSLILVSRFVGHTGWVNCVEVLPGEKQFLSGSSDFTIRLWDIDTFANLTILELDLCFRILTNSRHKLLRLSADREIFMGLPEYLQKAILEKMLQKVTMSPTPIGLTAEQFDLCRRIILSEEKIDLKEGSQEYSAFMALPEMVRVVLDDNVERTGGESEREQSYPEEVD